MPEAEPDAAARPRVLIVEDDEDLARLVELHLQHMDLEVSRARHGAEALEMVNADLPDLILLDVMMPVMDGWEALRRLKSGERTRDVPVVMLTALAEERDIIQGHLEGAVRYVTKPFEMRALREVVAEALEPPDAEERQRRSHTVRTLLQRLAELDAGRVGDQAVRISGLEHPPRKARRPSPREVDRRRLEELTANQREIAEALADGRSARELAEELGVSRSNVYATRKRIARKLGVTPDEVAEEAQRLGL